MTDLAELVFKIDSSGLEKGEANLDNLASASGRAEKATDKLEREFKKANATQLMSEGISRSVANGIAGVTGASGAGAVAVRGLTGALIGLSAPLSAILLTVGALGMAWKRERDQLFAFDVALAKTSGYAGKTAEELSMLAGAFGRLEGATRKGASEALLKVTDSGRFTEQQFIQISRAAALMEGSVGQSIDTTIDKFEKLADDPVKALLKLNESEHFLTRAQLDRVDAMVKEGREQDAVAEAVRIYSDRLTEVANKANAEMPAMTKLWRDVKDEINSTIGELGTFMNLLGEVAGTKMDAAIGGGSSGKIGKLWDFITSPSQQLGAINAAYSNAVQSGGLRTPQVQWKGIYGAGGEEIVDSPTENKAREAVEKAEREFGAYRERSLAKALKLEEDIVKMREAGVLAGKKEGELAKVEAEMRARYKESLPKGPKASKEAEREAQRALREAQRLVESQGQWHDRLLDLQADLEGPVAQANRDYQRQLSDLERAFQSGEVALGDYARMQDVLTLGRDRELEALEERLNPGRQLLRDLEFELELLRLTNAERATAIQLRGMEPDQIQKYGAAIEKLNKDIEDQMKRTELVDGFRDSFRGMVSDVLSGTDSIEGAFKKMLDQVNGMVLDRIATNFTDWLFGEKGQSGGGKGGDILNTVAGWFGGGRALGGDVRGDRYYRVGERNRPELLNMGRGQQFLIPGDAGRVEPMRGDGEGRPSVTVHAPITVNGRTDKRSAARIAQETAVAMRTAVSRNGGSA